MTLLLVAVEEGELLVIDDRLAAALSMAARRLPRWYREQGYPPLAGVDELVAMLGRARSATEGDTERQGATLLPETGAPAEGDPTNPLLTFQEVAEMVGVSKRTVYRLVEFGRLPAVRLSPRRRYIPRSALGALVEPAGALGQPRNGEGPLEAIPVHG